MAANQLLEPPPRNEEQIIRDAIRSGMFMNSAPSTRAALLKHVQQMKANAQVRERELCKKGVVPSSHPRRHKWITIEDYQKHCKAVLHLCAHSITK